MRCQTKDDFDALSTLISDLLIAKHGNHPLYAMFVNKLVVDVAGPLKDVECRKAASGLTTLSNAKQAEAKAGKGKGKKAGKPALGASKTVGAGRADMSTYDEVLDDGDYDDFVSTTTACASVPGTISHVADRHICDWLRPIRCRYPALACFPCNAASSYLQPFVVLVLSLFWYTIDLLLPSAATSHGSFAPRPPPLPGVWRQWRGQGQA